MRAAVFERTGPAHEVLNVVDLPTPEPSAGEVRVRMAVSGVNPTDWKSRAPGSRIEAPDGDGLTVPYQIPNQDGAGIIDAVGEGVDDARIGERVWVYMASNGGPQGTAAEYVCLPQERAIELPPDISYDQGAGLGIPYLTASRCLTANGDITGRTVLVTGGAGAVGYAAVQLGHLAGATVIATVSGPDKARLAQLAGADAVLNYRDEAFGEQLASAAPRGIDHVVDVAISSNYPQYAPALVNEAFVASYASPPSKQLTLPHGVLMSGNATLHFVLLYTLRAEELSAAAAAVSDALAAGQLTPLPDHRFALDEIADAHDALQAGAVGKVLVDIADLDR